MQAVPRQASRSLAISVDMALNLAKSKPSNDLASQTTKIMKMTFPITKVPPKCGVDRVGFR